MQIRKKRCAFEDGKMWKLKVGCVSLLSDGLRKAGMPIRLCKVYLELWLESGDRIFPTPYHSIFLGRTTELPLNSSRLPFSLFLAQSSG